jgi:hypothetical protein
MQSGASRTAVRPRVRDIQPPRSRGTTPNRPNAPVGVCPAWHCAGRIVRQYPNPTTVLGAPRAHAMLRACNSGHCRQTGTWESTSPFAIPARRFVDLRSVGATERDRRAGYPESMDSVPVCHQPDRNDRRFMRCVVGEPVTLGCRAGITARAISAEHLEDTKSAGCAAEQTVQVSAPTSGIRLSTAMNWHTTSTGRPP